MSITIEAKANHSVRDTTLELKITATYNMPPNQPYAFANEINGQANYRVGNTTFGAALKSEERISVERYIQAHLFRQASNGLRSTMTKGQSAPPRYLNVLIQETKKRLQDDFTEKVNAEIFKNSSTE